MRPSIRDVPQPENFDTGYYSWAERWEQSRQNQGGPECGDICGGSLTTPKAEPSFSLITFD